MAEYIEREALLDALYDADVITFTGMKILKKFPAADVQPVVHGEWINGCDTSGHYYKRCSKIWRGLFLRM